MTAVVRHPARYSDQVLVAMGQLVDQLVDDQGRTVQVLDPFAGTGRVHELGQHTSCELRTFGVELEPEWAGMHERTIVGDAQAAEPLDGTLRRGGHQPVLRQPHGRPSRSQGSVPLPT